MALKHIEGFDYCSTAGEITSIYETFDLTGTTVMEVVTGSARYGRGLRVAVGGGIGQGGRGSLGKIVGGTEDTMITGFAFKPDGDSNGAWIAGFYEGTTNHIDLRESGGNPKTLAITRNGTTLESETDAIVLGRWHYIEMKVTIGDAGSWEVRINGVTIMSGSGDTKNGGTGYVDRVWLGPHTGTEENYDLDFDDWYVCDDTGSVNNNFLGDMRVVALYPDGAGTTTQWDPSAGSNWQNVDETPVDGDTTYNSTNVPNELDLYTLTNLPETANTIHGIRQIVRHRKAEAGTKFIRQLIRTGSTNYEGPDLTVGDAYDYDSQLRETNPNTAVAWTESNINTGLEAGVKVL